MSLFKFRKPSNPITDAERYGFSFPDEPLGFTSDVALLCLMKALLVFCSCTGTLGGLLSAFHISYNETVFLFVMAVLSIVLAFLHYNSIVFNTVYPILFVLFTYLIMQFRMIANSGFQSFVSVLFEEYSSYFDLSISREVTILYTDQYLTLTVAVLFVGFFLALLLNIAISTYMSLFMTLILTFPFLQLSIYIEKFPSSVYLVFILFSYVTIGILGRSKHFALPLSKKKRKNFHIIKKKHEKSTVHSYVAKGSVLRNVTLVFLILAFAFSALSHRMLTSTTAQSKVSNNLKSATDNYVKIFVQSGLSGFFNRYEATGGMSGGQLGGVSSVRPDYQTDLKVTFAPYSYETIYLKAFTGADYTGTNWLPPSFTDQILKKYFFTDFEEYQHFSATLEARRLAALYEKNGETLFARMQIENIDAAQEYLYLPYYALDLSTYSDSSQEILNGSLPIGDTLDVTYYPPQNTGIATGAMNISSAEEVIDSLPLDGTERENSYAEVSALNSQIYYLNTPEYMQDTLLNIKDEIGTVFPLEEQALLIQEYLRENYTYSTTPGVTPYSEDFANYFLTGNKEGYCAHFATAATLIFRSYGYPARYIEGYVVTPTSISEGEYIESADYNDYISGKNTLTESGVLEVSVTDANAHAWVEVYKEGFGWIPIEVTPPSSGEDANAGGLISIFTNLFSVNQTGVSTSTTDIAANTTDTVSSFLDSTSLVFTPFILLVSIILIVIITVYLSKKLIVSIRRRKAFLQGNYAFVIPYHYQKLLQTYEKKTHPLPVGITPTELQSLLNDFLMITPDINKLAINNSMPVKSALDHVAFDLDTYFALLQKGCYSKDGIKKDDMLYIIHTTKVICKKIRTKK